MWFFLFCFLFFVSWLGVMGKIISLKLRAVSQNKVHEIGLLLAINEKLMQ